MPVRTAKSLAKHLDRVLQEYRRAGFNVRSILMDEEFEKLKNILPTVECNTTAAKEHMSKAKHSIRTVKERTQGLIGTFPFDNIPRQMKIKFVYFIVLWLNAFPVKTGVLSIYSPRELLCVGAWIIRNTAGCSQIPIAKYMTNLCPQTRWSHGCTRA